VIKGVSLKKLKYDDYIKTPKTKKIIKRLVSYFGSKSNLCKEVGVSPQLLCRWEKSNYPIKCPYPLRIYIASERTIFPWEINPIEYPTHLMQMQMIEGSKINISYRKKKNKIQDTAQEEANPKLNADK
jgi:hypothetical protein